MALEKIVQSQIEQWYSLRKTEENLWHKGYTFVAGVDEVGRGALSGPVVAAAVILPNDFCLPGLKDSKKASKNNRIAWAKIIKDACIAWAIGEASAMEIDSINIHRASLLAMDRAWRNLMIKPDMLLVDGRFPLPQKDVFQETIIKGDTISAVIMAASIVAKAHRDELMTTSDVKYLVYGFSRNKGYGTSEHIKALIEYGPCSIHRKSFISFLQENSFIQPSLFEPKFELKENAVY